MDALAVRRCAGLGLFAALLFECPWSLGREQQPVPLDFDRERVLSVDMRTRDVGPFRSQPYTARTGLVWRKVVAHPESVGAIRLHLTVAGSQGQASWTLKISDLFGTEVETFDRTSPGVSAGDIWTGEVRGAGAVAELWTDSDPGDLLVVLDKYAYRVIPSFAQAISGTDDRQPIGSAPAQVQQWARPVARLRFMVAGGGQATCTGFLVGSNLLMTNEHCIRTQSEMFSAVIEFGYNGYGVVPDRFRATALEAVNARLDYSLLRVAGNPAARHGVLRFDTEHDPQDRQNLVILQHPAGEPKQVSIRDCRVSGPQRAGVTPDLTDFGHLCDTLGGSSGSPVLDIATGRVIGLHHFGFTPSSPDPVNQGVQVRLILRDLEARAPNAFREISPPNP